MQGAPQARNAPGGRQQSVVVYSPAASILGGGSGRGLLADLRAARGLAWQLARRDVKAQYRGSLLGALWAFITPLVNAAVWIFLSASGIVRVSDTGMPYAAYVFSGTMLWQLFSEALANPIQQVTGAKSMLAKLNFPREAIVLSGGLRLLFGAGIKLAILIPAMFLLGVHPDARIALLPLVALAILLLGMAIGLFLTPVGMLYGDVARAIPLATQLLMYLAPVVYALPKEGLMHRLFLLNPMTPLLMTARAWASAGEGQLLAQAALVTTGALLLLLLALFFFRITMSVIIERMSS